MKILAFLLLTFPAMGQFLDSQGEAHPQKNETGGPGTRLLLKQGNPTNEPYAIGLNRGLLWHSVPPGCTYAWFTGGDLSARISAMGCFEFHPGTSAPGVKIDSSHNGDTHSDWDLVFHNKHTPVVHRLAGFRLTNDGHLEASNKISKTPDDPGTNVSARLSFNGWTSVSDERVKKNIKPLGNSLDLIKKLLPVTYQFNWEKGPDKHPGFTAQNVEKVFPSLVTDDGKLKTLNYAALSSVAIAAIQEQQATIKSLEQKNKELETRLQKLEELLLGN